MILKVTVEKKDKIASVTIVEQQIGDNEDPIADK